MEQDLKSLTGEALDQKIKALVAKIGTKDIPEDEKKDATELHTQCIQECIRRYSNPLLGHKSEMDDIESEIQKRKAEIETLECKKRALDKWKRDDNPDFEQECKFEWLEKGSRGVTRMCSECGRIVSLHFPHEIVDHNNKNGFGPCAAYSLPPKSGLWKLGYSFTGTVAIDKGKKLKRASKNVTIGIYPTIEFQTCWCEDRQGEERVSGEISFKKYFHSESSLYTWESERSAAQFSYNMRNPEIEEIRKEINKCLKGGQVTCLDSVESLLEPSRHA